MTAEETTHCVELYGWAARYYRFDLPFHDGAWTRADEQERKRIVARALTDIDGTTIEPEDLRLHSEKKWDGLERFCFSVAPPPPLPLSWYFRTYRWLCTAVGFDGESYKDEPTHAPVSQGWDPLFGHILPISIDPYMVNLLQLYVCFCAECRKTVFPGLSGSRRLHCSHTAA